MRVVVSFMSLSEDTDLGDAFWLADTPANRILAKWSWSSATTDPNSALFNKASGADVTATVLGVFDDVDFHHPNWREVRFLGTALTAEILTSFGEMQLRAEPTEDGFVVER